MSGWWPSRSARAATPLTKTIAALKSAKRYVRSIVGPARRQPGVRASSAATAAAPRSAGPAPAGLTRARTSGATGSRAAAAPCCPGASTTPPRRTGRRASRWRRRAARRTAPAPRPRSGRRRLAGEDLPAVVLAVGDVDEPVGVGREVVGDVEAPRVGPGRAPRDEVPALRVVLVHARVAVAVGDVDVARPRAERHVRRPVEGLPAVEHRRSVGVAEREQELSLGGEPPDRV